MSNSRIGAILVDMDVLASVFHFPEGYTVVDVRRIDSTPFRKFEVLCSGPTLPEVADGADIPQVRYMITQTDSGEMVRKREYAGTFEVMEDKFAPTSDEAAV